MGKYKYKYTNPEDIGYRKVHITKEQHNKIFPSRQIKWVDKYEYYINDDQIILHKLYSWKAVVVTTLLFPIEVIYVGIGNFKGAWKDLLKMYNQKESGTFVSEHVHKREDAYGRFTRAMVGF